MQTASVAPGPYLPVDLAPRRVAALPEANVGPYCSILAMQVTAVRTMQTFPKAGP